MVLQGSMLKYHDTKIFPVRGMSFNTTFRGMSVLRAMQKPTTGQSLLPAKIKLSATSGKVAQIEIN